MIDIINTWQFNLVAYLVLIVIFFQCYKKAVKSTSNDGAATVLIQCIGGVSIVLITPLFPFTFATEPSIYLLFILACIAFALADRLQTTARKHLQVSAISIIDQLVTVFLLVYGFTLFQEPVTDSKILGAFLILVGNVALFYQKGKFVFNKYTFIAIVATFCLATAFTIDIGIARQFNLPFYIMLTFIIPGILIMLVQRIEPGTVLQEFRTGKKFYYLLTGIAWSFAVFFSLRAFQFGEVSTIIPLQATAVILNVLIAYLWLGEREQKYKKIVVAILVFIGVYITTVG